MKDIQFHPEERQIDLVEVIKQYVSYWKWFVFGIVFSMCCAFLYLKFSTPIYKASITVMLKDDSKGGTTNEFTALSEMELLRGVKDNVENEIEVLRSRTLSEKVIEKLKLNISYYTQDAVKSTDLYKKSPIEFDLHALSELTQNSLLLLVNIVSPNNYELFFEEKKLGVYTFGDTIRTDLGTFRISKKDIKNPNSIKSIAIEVGNVSAVANAFRGTLSVGLLGKNTSVLQISCSHTSKEKAEDYLNTLIEIYNSEAIADRRYISENTSLFLSERLRVLTKELDDVEQQTEKLKKENHITNITNEADIYANSSSEFERQYLEVSTRIELIDNVMKGFLDTETTGRTFPILDALTSDPVLSSAIGEHNKLVILRNQLAENAGEKNLTIKQFDEQILSLKKGIKENLSLLKSNLEIQKSDIVKQQSVLVGRVRSVPTIEKELRGITRQQGVKEALFLYLLEKREEAEISMVALAPNAKVIDKALASDSPISPKKSIIYLISIVLGILIPLITIFLLTFFDTKIKGKTDLNRLEIPFLGDVPHSVSQETIIRNDDNSSFAESMRIIRANLDFIINGDSSLCKTIFVTSSVPQEGKTFIAMNLSGVLAASGKKTLLIEMDIRNSKIGRMLNLPSKGLVNYLISSDMDLESIVSKVDGIDNLYAIPAKVIPPNPAELLMSSKIADMFKQFRQMFDYIVVDTAPVSLVADTLSNAKHADAFIYVVRENYSNRQMLQIPQKLYEDKKLPNMCMLLNDTSPQESYYGYYPYSDKEKKGIRTFLKKLIGKK